MQRLIEWFRPRSLTILGLVLGGLGTAFLGAFTTGLANVAWRYAGDLYDEDNRAKRINDIHVSILMNDDFCGLDASAEFHNLITRYGVDDMFRDPAMATEQDKTDGQRQLLVKPASILKKNGACYLAFELPVHSYLGTQFKIYATPRNWIHIEQL